MGKKSFKNQKIYKMKGCSKRKSRRRLGGSQLAYTGQPIKTGPNPFLAYTGNGGGALESNTADNINLPPVADVMNPNTKLPSNPYGANPALPNTGPISLGIATTTTNMGSMQRGGYCNTCSNIMTGGNCGCGVLTGGKKKQKGGKTLDPQGLVGSPWTPNSQGWPGVDGVDGNRNYLALNNYKVDPQTALISVGANPPFLYGGRKASNGGRKRRFTKRKRQRGGALSNLLGQDFINLGRQIQYGIGSAYNGLNGYPAPTPVLPWQGQLPRTPNLYTIRGSAL